VVVMPSDFECFGVAAAEAMARGLPVVVTRSTGIAALVAAYGAGAVVGQNPGDLAAATNLLLTNDRAWELASDAARAAARELTPAHYGEQLLHLYSQIARARGTWP